MKSVIDLKATRKAMSGTASSMITKIGKYIYKKFEPKFTLILKWFLANGTKKKNGCLEPHCAFWVGMWKHLEMGAHTGLWRRVTSINQVTITGYL